MPASSVGGPIPAGADRYGAQVPSLKEPSVDAAHSMATPNGGENQRRYVAGRDIVDASSVGTEADRICQVTVIRSGSDSGGAVTTGESIQVLHIDSGEIVFRSPAIERTLAIEVPAGHYEFAVVRDECCSGPALRHHVTPDSATIKLHGPKRFDIRWTVEDGTAGGLVPGLSVQMMRTGESADVCFQPIRASADELGRLSVTDVCAGTYRVRLEAVGYEPFETEVELPGVFESLLSDGVLDWTGWTLFPLERYLFVLVGASESEGFELSSYLAVSESSARFDSNGHAWLDFADPLPPVELQLDYPGGDRSILYLPDLPKDPATPIQIDVGARAIVEVDVRVNPSLGDDLFDHEVYVQASFALPDGGSQQQNTRIYSEGVASISGPLASDVMISLTTVDKSGRMFPRAAREVTVIGGETTRTTLVVDDLLTWVEVLDESGSPETEAHVNIGTVPNRTRWSAGGRTDAEGRVPVVLPQGNELVLSCFRGYEPVALDYPVVPIDKRGVIQVQLKALVKSELSVLLDGAPDYDRVVWVEGELSASEQLTEFELIRGRSLPMLKLVHGSRAVARVPLRDGEWTDSPRTPVLPGLNQLRVRSTGFIRARSRAALTGVIELQSGTSVMDWVHSGRTGASDDGSGVVVVEVPVGAYEFVALDGSRSRVVVNKGMTASAY